MAGENMGLDLASQTGQNNIATQIAALITALGSVTGIQGPAGNDGIDGANGSDGRGIANISKTGTSGNVDTYTITFTDNQNPVTFTVTNTDMVYPSVDGTYILVISSGVASWVSVSDGDGGTY